MDAHGNADSLEIERFDKISNVWWDLGGEMHTLHTINPLRVGFIQENNILSDQKILDVGCGGGILAEALARAGATVTGIDLSQSSISAAQRHAESQGLLIDYRYESVEEYTREHAASFDIVTCMEMLEHVPQPKKIITACAQALKPGGQAYFSTINRTLQAFFFAILIGEYVLHLLPRGSHKYHNLIRPGELKQWAAECDLSFIRSASLMYHPLSGKFRVAPNKEDINYLAQFTKGR